VFVFFCFCFCFFIFFIFFYFERYQWCRGAKFAEIMKLTTIFEGSIIRAMRRLEELLHQLTVLLHILFFLSIALFILFIGGCKGNWKCRARNKVYSRNFPNQA
jgi:hypothetical protein